MNNSVKVLIVISFIEGRRTSKSVGMACTFRVGWVGGNGGGGNGYLQKSESSLRQKNNV